MPIKFSGFRDSHGEVVQALRVGHQGQTTILGVAATATSFTVSSPIARVVATIPTHVVWGVSTSTTIAATTDMLMPGNVVEYQVCDHGKTISCIAATATTGSLYVTEVL